MKENERSTFMNDQKYQLYMTEVVYGMIFVFRIEKVNFNFFYV